MRSLHLAAVILIACQGAESGSAQAPESTPEVAESAKPEPEPPRRDDPPPWWERDTPCPEGASLLGAAPPIGREIWCGLPDGRKHGRASKWSRLGAIKAEGEHRDGAKHGTFTGYHLNGQLSVRVDFVDGKENGPVTTWHSNGAKALEGAYKRGKGAGPWKKWDRDGVLVGEGNHDDGAPN